MQEIHLRRRAFPVHEILDIMGRRVRTSNLVFLDACRDNPFARSPQAGLSDDERGRFLTRSGLAQVRTRARSSPSPAPDNMALDGTGANSPFTAALVHHMATPNASINDVMIAVRRDVLKATGGRQETWDQSSLRERFAFHMAEAMALVKPPPVQPQLSKGAIFAKTALEHSDAVKGTNDPEPLRVFLADYGTSSLGSLAGDAMQKLATAAWRKVPRRDEAAVVSFIAHYSGTKEIAEASGVLAKVKAVRDAGAQKAAANAQLAAQRAKQVVRTGGWQGP